jgi:hypothetical protein
MKYLCIRRSNDAAVIAICCMPWLFTSNSTAKGGSHPSLAGIIAAVVVAVLTVALAFYVKRKRCSVTEGSH